MPKLGNLELLANDADLETKDRIANIALSFAVELFR